ncbi:MAG: hypothetical protein WD848_00560 [Dehalococcoidia bacterium]
MRLILLFISAVLLMVGCAQADAAPDTTPDTTRYTCELFRGSISDYFDGILTEAEFREEMKDVYDAAAGASPEVGEAARSMLAAATRNQGDPRRIPSSDRSFQGVIWRDFLAMSNEMTESCAAEGY